MNDIVKVPKTIEEWAMSGKKDFLTVASNETWAKEISFALQILRANPDNFKNCNLQSIRDAVINVGLTGVTLNPVLQQAYLIPRYMKGRGQCCTLDISYKGLIKIAVDSGSVDDIDATCAYEGDEFYYEMGVDPILRHIPSMTRDFKKIIAVYAVAVIQGSREKHKKFLVLMPEEIEEIRKSSKAKSSPWDDWKGEMAKKSVIKRFYKLLPQTERMSTAIDVLNQYEGIEIPEKKDLTGRFIAGKTPEALPEKIMSPLEQIEAISSLEILDDYCLKFKKEIEESPDRDILVEAIDYKRSMLKEAGNGGN